jgi:dimethylargininase
MTVAIVREVSASFVHAICSTPQTIDVARARAQHAVYVAALRSAGAEVIVLPPEDALPDACFVEDCAVVAGGVALIARPGAESRRAEPPNVRAALADRMPVFDMDAPATLDGGDCLRLGARLFIGRSSRTNAAGIARAREVFAPLGVEVVELAVTAGLHLKSLCSPLDDETVLAARGAPGFARAIIVRDAAAANVVVVGRHALVPAGFAAAARAVASVGLEPIAVDNSELRKADSALTCLSILV